jgi:hypothetical protein
LVKYHFLLLFKFKKKMSFFEPKVRLQNEDEDPREYREMFDKLSNAKTRLEAAWKSNDMATTEDGEPNMHIVRGRDIERQMLQNCETNRQIPDEMLKKIQETETPRWVMARPAEDLVEAENKSTSASIPSRKEQREFVDYRLLSRGPRVRISRRWWHAFLAWTSFTSENVRFLQTIF